MFDIDSGKLLIIGVVALVVIGPKDLPRVLRQVGQAVAKLRRMAGEFQGQFMEAVREADLQDLRDEVAKIKDSAALDVHFDPARDIQSEIVGAVEKSSSGPEAALPQADLPAVTAEPVPASLPSPEPDLEINPVAAGTAPVAEPVSVETEAAPVEPEGVDNKARRKIAAARRRDGSRVEGPAARGRGTAYLPPRQPRHEPADQ